MKRFPLLPQLALVFAVVYACSDSTAPANSNALLTPKNPALGFRGDPPPPPVETSTLVCTDATGCATYSGTYFSNGLTPQSPFNGNAWLKFDNTQPTASANAGFKRHDDEASGKGTLMINGQAVHITGVNDFMPFEACGQPGQTCASIRFRYTLDDGTEEFDDGRAHAVGCQFVPPEGSGSGFLDCGSGGE